MENEPPQKNSTRDLPPPYSTVAIQNPNYVGMGLGGPAYLPPLVKGQQVQSGPYSITVTDSMAQLRDRQNQEIYRAWLDQQRRINFPPDPDEEYTEAFKNVKIRRVFIQKVFCILFLQFLFTALYIAFFMFYEPANIFIKQSVWLWILALITFICSYCSISLSQCGRRQSGLGGICLVVLTLAESHLTAYVSVHYEVEVVLIAVGVTASVSILITFAATFFKFDFTKHAGMLSILSIVVLIAMISIVVTMMFTQIPVMITIFGALGALIFSLYLYYDIQTIMSGRTIQISPDEVIFATTQLYVDVIGLFRYLLLIIGSANRS